MAFWYLDMFFGIKHDEERLGDAVCNGFDSRFPPPRRYSPRQAFHQDYFICSWNISALLVMCTEGGKISKVVSW